VIVVVVAAAALAVILACLIAYPLLRPSPAATVSGPSPSAELVARRERIYTELRELEFDLRVGKITPADYAEGRDRLETEGARVLQALDLQARIADEEIEREVRLLRQNRRACSVCGVALAPGARFCPACGAPLKVAARR